MQVTDPVCGMQIESAKAVATAGFQGEIYYFCSATCSDMFRRAPERYAKKQTEGGRDRGSPGE
jgi:Cu+-exporting ATPase